MAIYDKAAFNTVQVVVIRVGRCDLLALFLAIFSSMGFESYLELISRSDKMLVLNQRIWVSFLRLGWTTLHKS